MRLEAAEDEEADLAAVVAERHLRHLRPSGCGAAAVHLHIAAVAGTAWTRNGLRALA